jgi:hypothetical protein
VCSEGTIIAKEVKKRGSKVAPRTVWKVLTHTGYSQYKLIVKPGLNELNKGERLAWCLEREHWTLDNWKDVIFIDETAIQLGGIRGKRYIETI